MPSSPGTPWGRPSIAPAISRAASKPLRAILMPPGMGASCSRSCRAQRARAYGSARVVSADGASLLVDDSSRQSERQSSCIVVFPLRDCSAHQRSGGPSHVLRRQLVLRLSELDCSLASEPARRSAAGRAHHVDTGRSHLSRRRADYRRKTAPRTGPLVERRD